MADPTFIGIGGHKCGTTWFFALLCEHPRIKSVWHVKEPCYFNYQYHRGKKWYEQLFKNDGVYGEASTGYLYYPMVPYLVKRDYPDVKTYVIIRNPIKRAWSHYWRNKRLGIEDKTFLDAIRTENRRITLSGKFEQFNYFTRGLYADFIKIWQDLFPDLLIMKFEDLVKQPQKHLNKVFDLLEIPRRNIDVKKIDNWMMNSDKLQLKWKRITNNPPMKQHAKELLKELYGPANDKLYDLCGIKW